MFTKELSSYFEEVVVLGEGMLKDLQVSDEGGFAPVVAAEWFELRQMEQYAELVLRPDDVLLVNDISFPGLFCGILYHKRPGRCYGICHASSLNRYDYFAPDRSSKYRQETAYSLLFDKVIVASHYHAQKLGWHNTVVFPLPFPPFSVADRYCEKRMDIVTVARKGIQKRTANIEKKVEEHFHTKILSPVGDSWVSYYGFLAQSKVMLITSKEETFGYQLYDAFLCGCIPVAPAICSYPELLPRDYLYKDISELFRIITKALRGELDAPTPLTLSDSLHFFERLGNLLRYGDN